MSDLNYPFSEDPLGSKVVSLAEGVLWARLPLPMSLDHINVYLLESSEGCWIVDTGLNTEQSKEVWRSLFKSALGNKPIAAVICTHMHPDHMGLAGWLCDEFKAPLYMSYCEFYNAQALTRLDNDDNCWQRRLFYQQHDMDEAWIEKQMSTKPGFGDYVSRLPMSFNRLSEGQTINIGLHNWKILVGHGHSPEHVCLYNEKSGLLISGDQVLPRISSNVSVHNTEPEANPLKLWIDSLQNLMSLPSDTVVLPAHGKPFTGIHYRLRKLIEGHMSGLASLENACKEPKQTSEKLMRVLFPHPLRGHHVGLALGETIAHLNYLIEKGGVKRSLIDGVYLYSSD